MKEANIKKYGEELYLALKEQRTVAPLTSREKEMDITDAYKISSEILNLRILDGEKVIGKKIGLTSKVVQKMLMVNQPDFGFLTDKMLYHTGDEVPISKELIQPKAEGEIAFILKKDIKGPGLSNADILRATEYVMPCFEIVDSRISDWKIKIQDTVADNASSGLFILGANAVKPSQVDLYTCGMVVEKNGSVVGTGAGAAALNSPVNAVTWLANTLGSLGITLKSGEIILSGSLVPMEEVVAGDHFRLDIGGIGSVSARFV